MKHKIEIAPNNAIYIDGERTIGSKPYGLFLTTTIIVSDDDLKRLADRCLAVIADRKTEPQKCDDCVWSVCNYNKVDWEQAEQTEPNNSGKPNNCEDCIWSVCNYNKAFEDEPQTERSE